MPTRIRAMHPFRGYAARGAVRGGGNESYSGALSAGENFGKMLAGGLGKAIDQSKMNAVANQLLQQHGWAPPPRAGLVAPGVNPQTGQPNVIGPLVSTAGTKPASGGTEELKLRMAEAEARQKLAGEQFNLSSAAAKQRMIEEAYQRGDGDGRSPWSRRGGKRPSVSQYIESQTGKTGKPAKYEAGSSGPDDDSYYNYNNQRTDVDSRYTKGTFDRLQNLPSIVSKDPKTGKWISADEEIAKVNPDTGDVTLMPKGGYAGARISNEDLRANMKRYDATTVQRGGNPTYTSQYMESQAPETGKEGGTQENPYLPKDKVDLNAIPPEKYFLNPNDNKVHQKLSPQGGQKTTQADTGDQGNQLAMYTPPEPLAPSQTPNMPDEGMPPDQGALLASASDFGQGDQSGLPGDPMLAEAIRRSRAAQQLSA